MISNVGRVFLSIGLALLLMSLLVRVASLSKADQVGDDLAIVSSAAVALVGAAASRYGSRHNR